MKTYYTIDFALQTTILVLGLLVGLLQYLLSDGLGGLVMLMIILACTNLLSAFIQIIVHPNKNLMLYFLFVVIYFLSGYVIAQLLDDYSYEGVFMYVYMIIAFLISTFYCFQLFQQFRIFYRKEVKN